MKYEITDAIVERFNKIYNTHAEGRFESFRVALEDFVSSIPSPLPTLRPIAEMPAEVPEGCERITGYFKPEDKWTIGNFAHPSDTFGIDILLPVESAEDKMRAEFEEKMKAEFSAAIPAHFTWVDGKFEDRFIQARFEGFKLAKSTPETK